MLAPDVWKKLPHAVEAVFFPANSAAGEQFARRVRRYLRSAYTLPDGQPPLVRYLDYERLVLPGSVEGPFELVDPAP